MAQHLAPLADAWLEDGLLPELAGDDTLRLRLRKQRRVSQVQTMSLCDDARRAIDRLEAEGVECLALKGLASVATLYGDPGLRPMHDVDLLVLPGSLDAATAALRDLGYEIHPMPNSNTLVSKRTAHSVFNIELHTFLCQPRRYPVDHAALWARAERVPWRDGTLRVLDPASGFLHTLINLVHDRFDAPLLKFMEANWKFVRLSDEQRADLAELATQCECNTAMKLLLDLLFDWFGHKRPEDLRPTPFDHFDAHNLPPYRSGVSKLRDLLFSAKLIDRPARRFAFAWDYLLRQAQVRPRALGPE